MLKRLTLGSALSVVGLVLAAAPGASAQAVPNSALDKSQARQSCLIVLVLAHAAG